MRTVTLSTIRTRVYRRADLENATLRYPQAEVDDEINESLAEFYAEMVRLRGQSYFSKTGTITTANGTSTYALPTDFFVQIGHPEVTQTNCITPLEPFLEVERGALQSAPTVGFPSYYLLRGQTSIKTANGNTASDDIIEFMPIPGDTYTITLYYIPNPPTLTANGDSWNGIAGFEEYAVCDAARKLAIKEDNQQLAAVLAAEKERIRDRMQAMIPVRDEAAPQRVKDIRGTEKRSFFYRYRP